MRDIYKILVVAVCSLCLLFPAIADEESDKDYRVKIAFIYNFLKFVSWPDDNSPTKTNVANVCIAGDRGFSAYFTEFKDAHKQALTINIINSVSSNNIASCHVLFIGKAEEDNVSTLLSYTKHHPILTISQAKDFVDNGGIIEMVRVGQSVGLFSKDKMNLRINDRAAEADNLKIDAQLLQIAAEVIK